MRPFAFFTCVLKHCRSRNDHRKSVGDDRVLLGVVVRVVVASEAGDGVGQPVTEVNPGVAEADAYKRTNDRLV